MTNKIKEIKTIKDLYEWARENNYENLSLLVETEGKLGHINTIEIEPSRYILVGCQ